MTQNQHKPMTVRELIDKLSEYDPNTEVQIYENNMFASSGIPKLVYSPAQPNIDEKPLLYIESDN